MTHLVARRGEGGTKDSDFNSDTQSFDSSHRTRHALGWIAFLEWLNGEFNFDHGRKPKPHYPNPVVGSSGITNAVLSGNT